MTGRESPAKHFYLKLLVELLQLLILGSVIILNTFRTTIILTPFDQAFYILMKKHNGLSRIFSMLMYSILRLLMETKVSSLTIAGKNKYFISELLPLN